MNSILPLLITLAVALNIYAKVVLVRSPRYERRQKWRQCGLIWLLPVIGAALVTLCLKRNHQRNRVAV